MSKAPAVDYALQIIELFTQRNKEMGIADITNELAINKNAVSRILEALIEKNWIYMSDTVSKKYRLTMRPFSIISSSVRKNEMLKIAEPILANLHAQLGDALYLGVKNGNNVLYLLHFDSLKEVRINGRMGGEYPLHCSAPGKVLLAYDLPSVVNDYFASCPKKRTENTIETAEAFQSECQIIKNFGYAVDNEEFGKGIICIACPIFNCDGEIVAAVGISSLTIYDDVNSLLFEKYPFLKQAADKISAMLGFSPLQ